MKYDELIKIKKDLKEEINNKATQLKLFENSDEYRPEVINRLTNDIVKLNSKLTEIIKSMFKYETKLSYSEYKKWYP